MVVLGLNLAKTSFGKELPNGGACIIGDGRVIAAIAEERLSRRKADIGFERALPYVLGAAGITTDEIDLTIISSCCEPTPQPERFLALKKRGIACVNSIPSHHLSHAYSAFYPSPFDRALIIVIDGGGSVLEPQSSNNWWEHTREQHSYYLGEGSNIRLIGRDFSQPFEAGFGEVYRAFTYYLGWHSSKHAGKTMALAAYGDPDRFASYSLFRQRSNRITSIISNDPYHPIQMVEQAAAKQGWEYGPTRLPNNDIEQYHMDLACFVQTQLEDAMVRIVQQLVKETGCRKLCLAGGVALNCLMNQEILNRTGIDEIYVQPAAGDQGQCLGNALYGYKQLGYDRTQMHDFPVYSGRTYYVDRSLLASMLTESRAEKDHINIEQVSDPAATAARLLTAGYIIGWFQGGSEFGPRALGNRSILANPMKLEARTKIDRIKSRDAFMPYAPSISEEDINDYFHLRQTSPYMLLAPQVKMSMRNRIPTVIHIDGTARLQTVSASDNPRFHKLLQEMKRLNDIPVVLNTSFNRESEPIVETPRQAVSCFLETNLDGIVIEDFVLLKRTNGTVNVI